MGDEKEVKPFIACDAEGCAWRNPAHRCSKCKLVYYCSQSCQRSDWTRHKMGCLSYEENKRMHAVAGIMNELSQIKDITFISEENAETTEPCGI